MVRNFSTVKGMPSLPARCWRKKTGRPESIRIASPASSRSGESSDQEDAGDDDVHRPLHRLGRARRVGEAEVEHRQLGEAVQLDPRPEQAVVLGQEGQRQARLLALFDQPLGAELAHLLFGDHDPLDPLGAGDLGDVGEAAEPRQLGRVLGVGGRGSRPGAGASPGGCTTRRATVSTVAGGPITMPIAIGVARCQTQRRTPRSTKAAEQGPDPRARSRFSVRAGRPG